MGTNYYYKAFKVADDLYGYKVYHYDESGNKEIVVAQKSGYMEEGAALGAACEWMEENGIDAELA